MSLVLIVAAALNAQPAPAPCIPGLQAGPVGAQQAGPCRPARPPVLMAIRDDKPAAPASIERIPNVFRQPAHCGPIVDGVVQRQAAALRGSRPMAEYAVARQIDGCLVPAPIGYPQDDLLPAEPETARPEGERSRRR